MGRGLRGSSWVHEMAQAARQGPLRVRGPPSGPGPWQHHPGLEGPQDLCLPPCSVLQARRPESSPRRPGRAPSCSFHGACRDRVSGGLSEASVTAGKKGQVHDSFTPESTSHHQLEVQSGFLWLRYKSLESRVSHRQAVRGFKAKMALGARAIRCKWASPPASL